MNYTLHQLRIFSCVAKHKSVTKAAQELFLTQPAVSLQLKKLQDQFDIPLTEVVGRQLFITEFGKEIEAVSDRILEASEEIKLTSDQFKGLVSGHLKFSVVSTGKYVMPYFLSGFARRFPTVDVTMDVTNKNQVVDTLTKNQTDFALVSVLPEDMQLEFVELMDNKLFLLGSGRDVSKIQELPLEPKDLSNYPLIFREQGSATRNAMEDFVKNHSIEVKRKYELTSNEAVKQAVSAGLGFSVMPLIGLRNVLRTEELKIVPIKGLPIVTTWMLCYLKGKKLSPAAQAYLSYLEAHKDQLTSDHFAWAKES